jgi:hypothetical protein
VPVDPAPLVENALFSPLDAFVFFVKDQVTKMCGFFFFWVFKTSPFTRDTKNIKYLGATLKKQNE